MKSIATLALLLPLAACSSQAPYAITTGSLKPGATMTVLVSKADLNAYKPAVGDPSDRFTVSASVQSNHAQPPAPVIRRAGNGITISAPDALGQLLVRVPDRVNLIVDSKNGAVNVTDVSGNVDVNAAKGDVRIMVAGYAQASTEDGHLSVTSGATEWPGTLKYYNGNGDTEIYIPAIAKFHVRMHTDDGTLFTDFGLRGTSQGTSETIDGTVNGGGSQNVDIEAKRGTIRLLRLAPQA